jgi:Tfp pilus assembly protein PilX
LKVFSMRRHTPHSLRSRQRGATLVVALLILVLIMMIGITAVSTSNTQYKLAGNLQFEDSALNNAEAAVTAAENWLATGVNYTNAAFTAVPATSHPDPVKDGTWLDNAAYMPEILPRTTLAAVRDERDVRAFRITWDDTNSLRVGGNVDGNVNQRYYIELISQNNRLQGSSQATGGRTSSACNQVDTYLITGRGASARGAVKFVQSYYSVLNCPA